MPSLVGVAESAMISAIAVLEKVRSTVSTPVSMAAGPAPRQSKSSGRSVALKAVLPWNVTRKLCTPLLPAMVAGVFTVPVSALVVELVVW